MNKYTLKNYCELNTQGAAAKALGVTQGAVWQMLRDDREIYITDSGDGNFSSYEVKRPKGEARHSNDLKV